MFLLILHLPPTHTHAHTLAMRIPAPRKKLLTMPQAITSFQLFHTNWKVVSSIFGASQHLVSCIHKHIKCREDPDTKNNKTMNREGLDKFIISVRKFLENEKFIPECKIGTLMTHLNLIQNTMCCHWSSLLLGFYWLLLNFVTMPFVHLHLKVTFTVQSLSKKLGNIILLPGCVTTRKVYFPKFWNSFTFWVTNFFLGFCFICVLLPASCFWAVHIANIFNPGKESSSCLNSYWTNNMWYLTHSCWN